MRDETGGLATQEARARLGRAGPNRVPAFAPQGPVASWARCLIDPAGLAILAVAAVLVGNGLLLWGGVVAGAAALLLALAALGLWVSRRLVAGLRRHMVRRARVIRDGRVASVPARRLVPGDLVVLAAGDRVPAPVLLLADHGLVLDGDALADAGSDPDADTDGARSIPAGAATVAAPADPAAPPSPERARRCPRGAMVRAGHAVARVEASETGGADRTRLRPAARPGRDDRRSGPAGTGRAEAGAEPRPRSGAPVIARLQRLSLGISAVALALSGLAAVVLLARGAVNPAGATLLVAGLAAAALPHGLAASGALCLAVATRRIARAGVLARSGRALERLARLRFLCLDREGLFGPEDGEPLLAALPDGTTIGAAELAATAAAEGETAAALRRLLASAAIAGLPRHDPWQGAHAPRSDPAGPALIALAADAGALPAPGPARAVRIDADPPRGLVAAAVREAGGEETLHLRGPADAVLGLCAAAGETGGARSAACALLSEAAARLAAEGAEVLAVARATLVPGQDGPAPGAPPEPLGLIALELPLHPETPATIAAIRAARIHVAMLTASDALPARAAGERTGLATPWESVVTGAALAAAERQGESAIDNLVRPARVFAELEPGQKALVAGSYRRDGHLVGVSGRDAADLPALGSAEPGLAPLSGAPDATLEAAGVILLDGRVRTLAAGIDGARQALDRVRRMTLARAGTGLGIALLFVLAAAATPMPPLSVQALLLLGLGLAAVGDLGAAFAPDAEPAAGRRRVPERVLPGALVLHAAAGAATLATAALAVLLLGQHGAHFPAETRGAVFVTLALGAAIRALAIARPLRPVFAPDPATNPVAWLAAAALVGLAVLATGLPAIGDRLGLAAVPAALWPAVLGAGAAVAAVEEVLRRRRMADPEPPRTGRRNRG